MAKLHANGPPLAGHGQSRATIVWWWEGKNKDMLIEEMARFSGQFFIGCTYKPQN